MANARRTLPELPAEVGSIVYDGMVSRHPDQELAAKIAAGVAEVVNEWVVDITARAELDASLSGPARKPTPSEMRDLQGRLAALAGGGDGGGGGHTPPGDVPDPPPHGPGEGDAAYVASVKDQLVAAGVSLRGAGAFQITKRVAWGLRGGGAGLLSKPQGNNVDGYAIDIIVYRDGRAYDILGDSGGKNSPMWGAVGVDDIEGRWREPVAP